MKDWSAAGEKIRVVDHVRETARLRSDPGSGQRPEVSDIFDLARVNDLEGPQLRRHDRKHKPLGDPALAGAEKVVAVLDSLHPKPGITEKAAHLTM